MTAYGACCVALAEALGCPLLTGDSRLANAPGAECVLKSSDTPPQNRLRLELLRHPMEPLSAKLGLLADDECDGHECDDSQDHRHYGNEGGGVSTGHVLPRQQLRHLDRGRDDQ